MCFFLLYNQIYPLEKDKSMKKKNVLEIFIVGRMFFLMLIYVKYLSMFENSNKIDKKCS